MCKENGTIMKDVIIIIIVIISIIIVVVVITFTFQLLLTWLLRRLGKLAYTYLAFHFKTHPYLRVDCKAIITGIPKKTKTRTREKCFSSTFYDI